VRLRPELAACVLLSWLGAASPGWCAEQAFSPVEIEQAIEAVKSDPNLASERTRRELVWDEPQQQKPQRTGWWQWIADLFGWLAGISQMLMWLLIAVLVAGLALLLMRLSGIRPAPKTSRAIAPTHVRDLDIRPESLPADIGAAARQLWERGERRAALALLYRALLSRLAHSYAVPIRDSSTEGDCLALAARTLDPHRIEYITGLVRTWQLAIYAGQKIEDGVVFEICAGFDTHLSRPEAGGAAA
jgi:hypothetical protein